MRKLRNTIIVFLSYFIAQGKITIAQFSLPKPLKYEESTISDFGFGLDLKPTVLPNGDLLVSISLLGGGFYTCKFLGKTEDGSLLYDRPVKQESFSKEYGLSRAIYVDGNQPEYFFTEKKTKRWVHVQFAKEDNLTVMKTTPVTVGGNPLIGDFTIIKNREGTFLVKYSYVNEGKSYWPGGKNPWVYPSNPEIGFNKGFDAKGNWKGEKTKAQFSYAEIVSKDNWEFGAYQKVLSNNQPLTLEFYQSPSRIFEVEVLGKKEQQILLTWDVDKVTLYETALLKGTLNFFEKKLPKGISERTKELYSGADISSTQPVYKDLAARPGFIMGGNPGILIEYYFDKKASEWKQRPVKMKGGDLHIQTLAAPQWIDWDGDGIADIIGGDSSGFIWFFKNTGTDETPVWKPGVKLEAKGKVIQHQAGLTGSIQGPNEKRWGYVQPFVVNWDNDGLLDILCNDVKGEYTVYKNIGSKQSPKLAEAIALEYTGKPFRAAWRSKPGVIPSHYLSSNFQSEQMLAINGSGILCRYARERTNADKLTEEIPLKWENGENIRIVGFAGHEGRATLSVCDYNRDGKWDILFGQGIHMFQSKEVEEAKPYATAYVLINKGTNEKPVFERPKVICQENGELINMDRHGCWVSPVLTKEGFVKDILAGGEDGRFYLFKNPKTCE
ncbi:FG-GAP repeat domain-containing protein [Pseudopedobacter beijingensis]|uniref:FG-GAP repeat domain-containing protein n=1 Tax=Pseudopedobacter beijingensis TaxID=1207056 RepID=A0ABW4I6Y2_9SPHI